MDQHDAPDNLSDTLDPKHKDALKKLWQINTTLTPTRAQAHHSMLNTENSEKLYTLAAIQNELDRLAADSVRNRSTADSRMARHPPRQESAANQAQDLRNSPSQTLGSPASAPSPSQAQIRISVAYGDVIARIPISPGLAFADFKTQVLTAHSLETAENQRMQLGYAIPEGWCVLHSDAAWTEALSDNIRSFTLRQPAGSVVSVSSDSASSASTIDSAAQPHRLSFASDGRIQAQKQWEYENKLRAHIQARVTAKLEHDGQTVGSPDVGTSVAGLRALLKNCSQLSTEWAMICAEQPNRDDGISQPKLLAWFISAVIDKFHPTIAHLWQSEDPTVRAKRLPTAFESFEVFLAHLYLTINPGISGAPAAVLPAMLADLQGRWHSMTYRGEICGELRQVLMAVQFLNDHLFDSAAADLTMPVKLFLEGPLADTVQSEFMRVLKQSHSEDLTRIFRESDDFAQLQAYNLESVLRRWAALDTMRGKLQPDEFKGSSIHVGHRTGGGGGGASGGSGSVQRNTLGGSQSASPPKPSAKEFHININGHPLTFRQNLASWTDQQDRLREEAKFVEAVYH
jgi:hypothetical protein